MTVCIAAINQGGGLIGATDRKLTLDHDISFEQVVSKIYVLAPGETPQYLWKDHPPRFIALTSGTAELCDEIISRVQKKIQEKHKKDPSYKWKVNEMVEMYLDSWNESKTKRAEISILKSRRMTWEDYTTKLKEFPTEIAREIVEELKNFKIGNISVLICGIDEGPHIVKIVNGDFNSENKVGYAVIGSGTGLAEAQMMQFYHFARPTFHDSLLAVVFAKKKAEDDAWVGEETDLVSIGTEAFGVFIEGDDYLKEIEKIYERYKSGDKKRLEACKKINDKKLIAFYKRNNP